MKRSHTERGLKKEQSPSPNSSSSKQEVGGLRHIWFLPNLRTSASLAPSQQHFSESTVPPEGRGWESGDGVAADPGGMPHLDCKNESQK